MEINGLQKLTLLDYPGKTACTIFIGRCNFRCPFCHNSSLVLHPNTLPTIPEGEIMGFLKKRSGLLDGVCITGGEPTLSPELLPFMSKIKDLGYKVKLDTNGSRPDILKQAVSLGLADYVAMDIKSSPKGYAKVSGIAGLNMQPILESTSYLMEKHVPFEFRTTVVRELHSVDDIAAIGEWLAGDELYFIQNFKQSEDVICSGLSSCTRPELEAMLAAVKPYIPAAALRGVD